MGWRRVAAAGRWPLRGGNSSGTDSVEPLSYQTGQDRHARDNGSRVFREDNNQPRDSDEQASDAQVLTTLYGITRIGEVHMDSKKGKVAGASAAVSYLACSRQVHRSERLQARARRTNWPQKPVERMLGNGLNADRNPSPPIWRTRDNGSCKERVRAACGEIRRQADESSKGTDADRGKNFSRSELRCAVADDAVADLGSEPGRSG